MPVRTAGANRPWRQLGGPIPFSVVKSNIAMLVKLSPMATAAPELAADRCVTAVTSPSCSAPAVAAKAVAALGRDVFAVAAGRPLSL